MSELHFIFIKSITFTENVTLLGSLMCVCVCVCVCVFTTMRLKGEARGHDMYNTIKFFIKFYEAGNVCN